MYKTVKPKTAAVVLIARVFNPLTGALNRRATDNYTQQCDDWYTDR